MRKRARREGKSGRGGGENVDKEKRWKRRGVEEKEERRRIKRKRRR